MQDTLQPKADQLAEEGVKPAGKHAKDAVEKAQEKIPQPEDSKAVAEEQVGKAAKPAADAVKKNARPMADKVKKKKTLSKIKALGTFVERYLTPFCLMLVLAV